MKSVVKIVTNTPEKASAPKTYAQIDDQGRIPYGKTAEVKIPTTMKRMNARGMGAATQGGKYNGCA